MPSPLFRIRPDASPRRLVRIMTPPMAQGMKPPLEPTIATARLLLRPPLEADIPAFAAGLDEIEVVRMLARVPFPYSLEDGRDFLASARDSARWGTDVNLVITRQDEILGCIGLADIPAINELGYWLGRPYWRQGFASEAVAAFLAWAFDELGVTTITSGAFSDNPASLRVQEKNGFERIGASMRPSLARGRDVEHIDTVLTKARYDEFRR